MLSPWWSSSDCYLRYSRVWEES